MDFSKENNKLIEFGENIKLIKVRRLYLKLLCKFVLIRKDTTADSLDSLCALYFSRMDEYISTKKDKLIELWSKNQNDIFYDNLDSLFEMTLVFYMFYDGILVPFENFNKWGLNITSFMILESFNLSMEEVGLSFREIEGCLGILCKILSEEVNQNVDSFSDLCKIVKGGYKW